MTSQRRRPEQTQRRLAIQASSRRNRVASARVDARTDGRLEERWERESYRDDHSVEEPIRPSFRSDYDDGHHADRFQNRQYEIEHGRYVDHSSFGNQDDHYRDERVDENRRYRNAYESHDTYDSHWAEPMGNERRYSDPYDNYRQPDTWNSREPYGQSRGRSELDQDLEAMGKVWSMIRQGAVRMLGEVGRQY